MNATSTVVNDKELIAFDSPAAQHNGINKLVTWKAMLLTLMVRLHSIQCCLDTAKTTSNRWPTHLTADKSVICNHKAQTTNCISCDHEADRDCCITQMVYAIQQKIYFTSHLQHAKMVANRCTENARILPVDVAYEAEGGAVAHSAQHEEEGIAHHEHVAEEKGRLHEA